MSNTALDIAFNQAFEKASNMSQESLPPDVQLRLYAFYKQATLGNSIYHSNPHDLRNAFKMNAWMQVSQLTSDEAKDAYIKEVEKIDKNLY